MCGLTGMGEYTFLQVTPRDVCDPLRKFAYYMWCVCVCVFGRGVCLGGACVCVCVYMGWNGGHRRCYQVTLVVPWDCVCYEYHYRVCYTCSGFNAHSVFFGSLFVCVCMCVMIFQCVGRVCVCV